MRFKPARVGDPALVRDQVVLRLRERHLCLDHVELCHRAGVVPRLRLVEKLLRQPARFLEVLAVLERHEQRVVRLVRLEDHELPLERVRLVDASQFPFGGPALEQDLGWKRDSDAE
jgi:hypothetical protein